MRVAKYLVPFSRGNSGGGRGVLYCFMESGALAHFCSDIEFGYGVLVGNIDMLGAID